MLLRREEKMNLFDLANLLDNDGNLQNEMMVMAFAATLLSTIPGMYILCTLECPTRTHMSFKMK